MRLITYSLREVHKRPVRTLLTLVGITLGIASLVAIRLTIQTVHQAYHDLFAGSDAGTSLEITAPGQGGFDPQFSSAIAFIPGVRTVVPRIQGTVAVLGKTASVPVVIQGMALDTAVAEGIVADTHALAGDDNVLMTADLAEGLGLRVGEAVHLWTSSGQVEMRLAGPLPASGATASVGGSMLVSLHTAQRLFALEDRVNSVQVRLDDAADLDAVRVAISTKLPSGVAVQAQGSREALAFQTLHSTEQGLTCLSVVALIAAAFVILNTLLLTIGERRYHLALLQALGATRHQIMRLLLGEMLLLGLTGTVAGCAVGLGLTFVLLRVMQQFLGVSLPPLTWHAEPFVLAFLLGPGIALAAALVPGWQAGRRPPLPDLLARRGLAQTVAPRKFMLAGLPVLASGAILAVALCKDWLPSSVSRGFLVPTLVMLIIGGVLILPLLAAPSLRLLGGMLRPILRLEGVLSCQQLERHPTRAGLAAGVLFVALAVSIGFGQSLLGMLHDLQHWYEQTFVSDYLIRSAMPDTAFALSAAMPEDLGEEIGKLDDVATVERIAFLAQQSGEHSVLVLARTFSPDRPLPLDLQEGEPASVLHGLQCGEVVLGTELARQTGLHAGDTLPLETSGGRRELRVAGIATEFAVGGHALYLEWNAAQRLLDFHGVHAFLVTANPGSARALAPALRTFCQQHRLMVQSNAEMRSVIDRLEARVTGALWALMALTFIVAALGIVNTLIMNVYDQTREFGLLRALGFKAGQIRRVVLWQALLLGMLSLLPGAIGGLGLAQLIQRCGSFGAGPHRIVSVDWLLLIGSSVVAIGVTFLAGLLPARKAGHIPILMVLQQ
jgi:putative ABC transport system permease protein